MVLRARTAAEAFEAFEGRLERGGVGAALAGALALTEYRFVGVFRRHEGCAVPLVVHDRERPAASAPVAVPREVAQACFFRNERGSLTTLGHRKAEPAAPDAGSAGDKGFTCRSVPVIDSEGLLYGSLCLYDTTAPPARHELDLLLWLPIASRLASARHLPRPEE